MSQVLAGEATVDLGVTTGPFYTITRAMFRDGGQYKCLCANGGQECRYNVSGLLIVTFFISHKAYSTDVHG